MARPGLGQTIECAACEYKVRSYPAFLAGVLPRWGGTLHLLPPFLLPSSSWDWTESLIKYWNTQTPSILWSAISWSRQGDGKPEWLGSMSASCPWHFAYQGSPLEVAQVWHTMLSTLQTFVLPFLFYFQVLIVFQWVSSLEEEYSQGRVCREDWWPFLAVV